VLEEGVPARVEVEVATLERAMLRGLMVGAAPPDAGDAIDRAVVAAAGADVAVVVVGTNDDWETEGNDRADMDLPGSQDELVRRVAAANPRTIVVVNAGSPVSMPWLHDAAAVMQVWFPGEEVGNAVSDVLLGDAEPGGRPADDDARAASPTRLRTSRTPRERHRALQRGAVHRLQVVRRPRHRTAVPVRARPRLHELAAGRRRGHRCADRRCLRESAGHQRRRAAGVDGRAVLRAPPKDGRADRCGSCARSPRCCSSRRRRATWSSV
jgi:hypothetical protein